MTHDTDQAEHERNNRSAQLAERAHVLLAYAIQEAERDQIHGRIGVEIEIRDGRIDLIKRTLTASEK